MFRKDLIELLEHNPMELMELARIMEQPLKEVEADLHQLKRPRSCHPCPQREVFFRGIAPVAVGVEVAERQLLFLSPGDAGN